MFELGTYSMPRAYEVLRLIESDDGRITGREVLAEVSFVTEHPGDHGPTFVVSVRPWRGAGTQGSDEAFVRERRAAMDELEEVLLLLGTTLPGDMRDRLRSLALRALARVRSMTVVEEPIAAE